MRTPVTGEDWCDTDDFAGSRGVDLKAITDINADMRDTRLVRVGEENEVSQLRFDDGTCRVELVDCDAWQMDPHSQVHILNQATAINSST